MIEILYEDNVLRVRINKRTKEVFIENKTYAEELRVDASKRLKTSINNGGDFFRHKTVNGLDTVEIG